jgi:hypothetical protein
MTVEYVLLLSLFVLYVMGAMVRGPNESFSNAAPRLGARVEKHIITGDGFNRKDGGQQTIIDWKGDR